MAGASAADVRSILSLPTPGTPSSSTPTQSQPRKTGAKKPEGISRELYNLIGGSTPTLVAQLAKPRLKQKPNLGGSHKVKWERRPFENKARSDGLQLQHWVKANTDPNADYRFSKYNVQNTIYTYSQDEYNRLLEDPDWTKEETDYLFDLMREYDMRWYIVHDRYDFPGGPERPLEDLKDRYCSVTRKLVRSRPWAGDEPSRLSLLTSLNFDKDREKTRKKWLQSLANRTPAQIAEEEALFIEIKRLEQNERRFKREREELLRTLAGVESGLEGLPIDDEGPFGNPTGDVKKKNKKGPEVETPSSAGPSNAIALSQPTPRKAQSAKSAAYDAMHCIYRTTPPPTTMLSTKNAHTPVYIRSFKIPVPRPASNAPKITAALAELGVNASRLVMPTKENFERLEGLLEATSSLIALKAQVDKVEHEIRVSRERLGSTSMSVSASVSAAPSVAGDEAPSTTGETPMEVDQDDAGTERDAEGDREESVRAPSVVSTRSGRGRRQSTRRSMSISSVDTSATMAMRANKRQKHK